MKWKSALPLSITIKSSCVSQSTWILYPGFFILAGCSVMAWAICEAGSDKVQCLAVHSGKQVHFFLILKGCTSSFVVRMRHVEIKSGDISCRTEDFLPRVGKIETSYSRRWTRSCWILGENWLFCLLFACLSSVLKDPNPLNRNSFAAGMKQFNPHYEQHSKQVQEMALTRRYSNFKERWTFCQK